AQQRFHRGAERAQARREGDHLFIQRPHRQGPSELQLWGLRKEATVLTMTGLTKTYRTDTVETTALDDVDLDIADGEFVAIMGPSGCGKSTLLNVMGMLDSPTGGSYVFNGQEVAGLTEAQLADTRKSNIGFIFQSFNLVDELTVRENVELGLLYHSHPASERRERVDRVLDKVGIAHRAKHRPTQLSGGQQQRV